MPKSSNQKLKLLYLMKILLSETDAGHYLTISELEERLLVHDIKAERKTLYDDIEALRKYGLDIKMEKSKGYYYFVADRDFQLPELKLLVDAVQSSKFITAKKSSELIKKLEGFASRHEASQLHRQVFVQNRVKTMNEMIYYNVDRIHEAIALKRKISFRYFQYTVDKEKQYKRDGERYTANPVTLTWDDENYYLITYSPKHSGLTHYRVDKMTDIEVAEDPCETGHEGEFDIAAYAKQVFGMFGGDEQPVTLRFSNEKIGVVLDRFGFDVPVRKDGDGHFIITVKVSVSPVFMGWLFSFGKDVTVLSPAELGEELKRRAAELLEQYG